MAKYDNTRFYWLQLKEDFFDDDAIDWLEEQPNGKEYSLFYLKLCLKSLRTNGILIRKVGTMLIPYDAAKLGELTKTNPDTVMVAMNLLIQIGLVQKLENGELYVTQVENMIGSQSKGAFKKQQQRLQGKDETLLLDDSGQKGDKCPPEKELEKELEKEIDKEIDKEVESIPLTEKPQTDKKEKYGTFNNVRLTPSEYEKLSIEFKNYLEAIEYLSEYLESTGKKYKSHYLALRRWVFDALKEQELKKKELEQREKRAAEIAKKQTLNELKDFYGNPAQNFKGRDYTKEQVNSIFENIPSIEEYDI